MILIENILIDEEIFTVKFCCDLAQCRGGCCTMEGGLGAPVADAELALIEGAQEAASKYLSEHSKKILATHGGVEGSPGNYNTVCIDNKDCVFVYYEGGIAKCALEKAFFAGETNFRKPLSCHLFPIRETSFGGKYIFYQEFEECSPALEFGEKNKVPMYVLVKDALIRAYGAEWYEKLVAYAEEHYPVR